MRRARTSFEAVDGSMRFVSDAMERLKNNSRRFWSGGPIQLYPVARLAIVPTGNTPFPRRLCQDDPSSSRNRIKLACKHHFRHINPGELRFASKILAKGKGDLQRPVSGMRCPEILVAFSRDLRLPQTTILCGTMYFFLANDRTGRRGADAGGSGFSSPAEAPSRGVIVVRHPLRKTADWTSGSLSET